MKSLWNRLTNRQKNRVYEIVTGTLLVVMPVWISVRYGAMWGILGFIVALTLLVGIVVYTIRD